MVFNSKNPKSSFFSSTIEYDLILYQRYRQRIKNAEENLLDRMPRHLESKFYIYMSKFVKERDELRRLGNG